MPGRVSHTETEAGLRGTSFPRKNAVFVLFTVRNTEIAFDKSPNYILGLCRSKMETNVNNPKTAGPFSTAQ